MSNREESEYDRQFQADLQKAIALSLESSEFEHFRNEQRRKLLGLPDNSEDSRRNSVDAFQKPKSRSKVTIKSNFSLPPPPSSSMRRNSSATSTNDLITFNSPKDEKDSTNEFDGFKTIESSKSSLFSANNNCQSSLFTDLSIPCSSTSNSSVVTYRPLGFSSFGESVNTGMSISSNNTIAKPKNPSNYGFKSEVTDYFPNYKDTTLSGQSYLLQKTGGSSSKATNYVKSNFLDVDNQKFELNENSLDVLKIVGKQQNNNLIDLVPFSLGDVKKSNTDEKSSVLEEFDPLMESFMLQNNEKVFPKESKVLKQDCDERERKSQMPNKIVANEIVTDNEDCDNDDGDFDDGGSACSGSFYDPFDPFDYMNTPSIDGSLGEPMYTTVVKVDKDPSLPSRNRKSLFEINVSHNCYVFHLKFLLYFFKKIYIYIFNVLLEPKTN